MKMNMGNTDRIVRVLLAAVFATLYFTGVVTGNAGVVLLILGGIFIVTSIVGFCPLYLPFKFNTCSRKKTAS